MRRLVCVPAVLLLFCSAARADIMASVTTLDGTTGLPLPGSEFSNTGTTFASVNVIRNYGGSRFDALSSGEVTTFFANNREFSSLQFKTGVGVENPPGMNGEPEAFEGYADLLWRDTISVGANSGALLQQELLLKFDITGILAATQDVLTPAPTVFSVFELQSESIPGLVENSFVQVTNADGGNLELDATNWTGTTMFDATTGQFKTTASVRVRRDELFTIRFRSVAGLGNDGKASSDFGNTISLVDVSSGDGAESYNDIFFDSGAQFSSTSVPEPSAVALMGLGALGLGVVRLRRRHDRRSEQTVPTDRNTAA